MPAIIENKPLQSEARHLRFVSVPVRPVGTYFLIMTGVLYIIPDIMTGFLYIIPCITNWQACCYIIREIHMNIELLGPKTLSLE